MKKYNMLLVLPLIAFMVGCGANAGQSGSQGSQEGSQSASSTGSQGSESSEGSQVSQSDSSESSSSESPVLHPSVTIANGERSVYITKQLTLTAEVVDSEDSIVWASSDTAKATVEGGVVSAIAPGKVTITASLQNNASVKDEVEITVLDTIIDASVNTAAWDFSKLYQDNAVIESVAGDNANNTKTYAAFKNISGKQYVAKAHFNVKSVGDWVWNSLTIGHINGEGKIYATGFSQGTKKIITQFSKTVGGVEQQWDVISTRSQVWNQHDLESLDVTNGVDIMAVRDNGEFYFFINNELYWKEGTSFTEYDAIDTQPVIYLNSVNAEVTNLYASAVAADVEEVVNSAAAQKKFFPTFGAHVVISENDTKIQFKNTDTITTNNKDIAAKSIGDAFLLPAGKASKVEFDLVIDQWGGTDATPVVSIDMKRYDSDPGETRSFLIGETGISFAGWNYDYNMPAGFPAGETKYVENEVNVKMAEEAKYHIVCTRLMEAGGQDTKLEVFKGETAIGVMQHGWQDGYKGNAVVYFSVRNVNATITNIALTVAE